MPAVPEKPDRSMPGPVGRDWLKVSDMFAPDPKPEPQWFLLCPGRLSPQAVTTIADHFERLDIGNRPVILTEGLTPAVFDGKTFVTPERTIAVTDDQCDRLIEAIEAAQTPVEPKREPNPSQSGA